jgi:clan AA aspartic protease
MGEIRVKVVVENDRDRLLHQEGYVEASMIRRQEIDALVDTGAVMVLLPQDLVEAIGLKKNGKAIVTLANEERVEFEIAYGMGLTIAGRSWITDCLVGPPGCEPLIGHLVLERLDLVVDPLQRKVTPRPKSPFLPSLKLK